MKQSKDRITAIVKGYILLHPEEFEAFKEGMNAVRASIKDEEFGTLEGTEYTRALYEMPETLQTMLIMSLPEEDMLWLKDGIPSDRKQGGRWFATNFPVFRIPDKV